MAAKKRFLCVCGRDIGGRANIERHKAVCAKHLAHVKKAKEDAWSSPPAGKGTGSLLIPALLRYLIDEQPQMALSVAMFVPSILAYCAEHPEFIAGLLERSGVRAVSMGPTEVPSPYGYMVLINREGVSDATLFERETEAEVYYEKARLQWSDSFLTRIVRGPRDWMDTLQGMRPSEEGSGERWLGLPLATLYACIDRQVYELYSTMSNPEGWSRGRTRSNEELRQIAEEDIRVRYRGGLCAFCNGPAMRCAPRHAEGRSCS